MQQTVHTVEATGVSRKLYSVVQQEVELGAQALKSGSEMAITFFQSALNKLTVDQPFYDHLVHNLLLGYKLLIGKRLKSGDIQTAVDFLRAAVRLEINGEMADDTAFLKKFAGEFQSLSVEFLQNGCAIASLACCRKAISIYQGAGSHINLTNALLATGQRAVLSDFTNEITPEQLGRHIFISCAPKSGSTFLKNLLLNLTGYADAFMVASPGQFEQELYLPTLEEMAHLDTVTQQHTRASDANLHLMQAFGIKPVVLVRNIFDSVVSLLDFYDKGAYKNSFYRDDWPSLDAETKIDLVIDNLVPWYFQFVASWNLAERQKRIDVHWLTYEEMIEDKTASVLKVLEFYGLGAARRGVEQRIKEIESDSRRNRFNKGVAGRGKAVLNDKQKDRIRSLARYYPGTDLSRIGL